MNISGYEGYSDKSFSYFSINAAYQVSRSSTLMLQATKESEKSTVLPFSDTKA